MSDAEDLPAIRVQIEQVDRELLTQLRRRMELSEGVARAKLASATPFRDPPREEQVLQRVRQLATELKLDPHRIERLYRQIMEMSIARQQEHVKSLETAPLRVAYCGVEGSYSHLAAQKRYAQRPGGVLLTGYETIREVGESLKTGAQDFGLLQIENTAAGSMNETYDLLAEGGLTLTAELVSSLEHRLLLLPGAQPENLRTVLSHPQALIQCEAFFRARPWIRPQAELDTAGAAKKVKDGNDPTVGAIASASAGTMLGLQIHPQSPAEGAFNYTRFVEVAVEAAPCSTEQPCKTSVLVALEHRPGALGEVLAQLTRHGVNLTKIESRPIRGATWRYRFYLDLEGHAASREVSAALEAIRPLTSELRLLGSYPRAGESS